MFIFGPSLTHYSFAMGRFDFFKSKGWWIRLSKQVAFYGLAFFFLNALWDGEFRLRSLLIGTLVAVSSTLISSIRAKR